MAQQTISRETCVAAVEAVRVHGSCSAAAEALGIARATMGNRIIRAAQLYGLRVEQMSNNPVPNGFGIKGTTTYYKLPPNEFGATGQWVRTTAQQERENGLIERLQEAFADLPKAPKIAPQRRVSRDLAACLVMGDPHLGMYAWKDEAGEDFDLNIAERDLVSATYRLVEATPACEHALIVNVGDFFHSDNNSGTTMRNNNKLDVDTRWAKVLQVGLRAMRACIEAALTKHRKVHVINAIGNHDDHTSRILCVALASVYEKNPRVTFEMSPAHFHYWRFGRCLVGVTHGDKVKLEQLGQIMATDKPEDWGATQHRVWYTGHVHHRRVFEVPGCLIESFRTLAARDAWAASMGYRSGRDMQAIVLHREYGEVERHRCDVQMLR